MAVEEAVKPAVVSKDFDLFGDDFAATPVPDTNVEPISSDVENPLEADSSTTETTESVVPATKARPSSPATAAKFTREIDLGDGSGKQVFSANSETELIDKLVAAQTNATSKIREQQHEIRRAARRQPERAATPNATTAPAAALSADELFAISQELQKNPDAAIEKLVKAKTGITLEEIGTFVKSQQDVAAKNAANFEFLTSHKEDYVDSTPNAQRIQKFLVDEKLPYTAANLEYAFQELTESGLLDVPTPASTEEVDPATGKRIVVPAYTRSKPKTTGLRNSQGSARNTEAEPKKAGEMTTEEIEQLYRMPLEDARQAMLKKMNAARAPSDF